MVSQADLQILIESLGACGFSFFLSPPSPGRAERPLGEFHSHTEGICVPSAFWQSACTTQGLCTMASTVSTRSNAQTLAASKTLCRDTYDPPCGAGAACHADLLGASRAKSVRGPALPLLSFISLVFPVVVGGR